MKATLYVILIYETEEGITHLKNIKAAEINNIVTALIDDGGKDEYSNIKKMHRKNMLLI